MKVIAIVPARMSATRFPNKPLVQICGLPMIEHVRRRLLLCPSLTSVVVATCDTAILDAVHSFGGQAVMTSDRHVRCTDRVAEAALHLDADIIVNVQGDEPLVMPEMIEQVLKPFINHGTECSNLLSPIRTVEEFNSRNIVKTVFNRAGNILYYSRCPIPYQMSGQYPSPLGFKQLGIIAFKKQLLLRYSQLDPTKYEIAESVDMMRLIEHGYTIASALTDFTSVGVDIPSDVEAAEILLKQDSLFAGYQRHV